MGDGTELDPQHMLPGDKCTGQEGGATGEAAVWGGRTGRGVGLSLRWISRAGGWVQCCRSGLRGILLLPCVRYVSRAGGGERTEMVSGGRRPGLKCLGSCVGSPALEQQEAGGQDGGAL